jgi:hypothetical protein
MRVVRGGREKDAGGVNKVDEEEIDEVNKIDEIDIDDVEEEGEDT